MKKLLIIMVISVVAAWATSSFPPIQFTPEDEDPCCDKGAIVDAKGFPFIISGQHCGGVTGQCFELQNTKRGYIANFIAYFLILWVVVWVISKFTRKDAIQNN